MSAKVFLWQSGLPFVAQAGDVGQVMTWAIVLIVVIVVMFVGVVFLKRWMWTAAEAPPAGFSLSDLRRLRDSGQMSQEEYEKARSQVVGKVERPAGSADSSGPKSDPGRR